MEQIVDSLENTLASVCSEDDRYQTEPMTAVTAEHPLSEEELHRLFEEAINDRVLVVSACLSRISRPLAFQALTIEDGRFSDHVESSMITNRLRVSGSAGRWLSLWNNTWQQAILLLSLTLFFLLSGFDLMGVIVLHLR
jgi:hypothetical protein